MKCSSCFRLLVSNIVDISFIFALYLFVDCLSNTPNFGCFADIIDLTDEEQRPAASVSSSGLDSRHTESNLEPSTKQVVPEVVAEEAVQSIVYPALPEEPENKTPGACRVGFRFPDGSRSNRRFMMSDSVKVLLKKTFALYLNVNLSRCFISSPMFCGVGNDSRL